MIWNRWCPVKMTQVKKGTNKKLAKNGTFSILGWKICMVWRFGENFNTSV